MKYDKHAISNAANRLKNKSSGFNSIQNKLSNVSPNKCNANFYSKRYSLVKRIRNVQTEINSLSTDINSAANKMSSDDVQNARYIRQVFNNRASLLSFGNRGFGPGQTGLSRTGIFGGSMMFSSMALNRRNVSSFGKSSTMADVWTRLGNAFKNGASFLGNKANEFGHQAYNATSNFFSNAGKWVSDRWNDVVSFGNSAKDYVWRSAVKLVLGDYDENHNVTILSFGANLIAGFFDVDLPLDVRDLVYDVQHWGEGDNFGIYFALDCLAVVPIIGVVKYIKYVDDFADGAKDLGKVVEAGSEAGKTIDNISDAADNGKDLGNVAESAQEAGKASGNAADATDASTDLGKSADQVERPTWRQSEIDAAKDFPDYEPQKSFINGEEVPYGTKGSVRPDYYKPGHSVDIKNYNVETPSGRSNLARNIEEQYFQRLKDLPEGTQQTVLIDIRGQNVSDFDLQALYDNIMRRTNNGIEIIFKMCD